MDTIVDIETLNSRLKDMLDIAYEEAKCSDYGFFHHGAVLFRGPKVINSGHNSNGFTRWVRQPRHIREEGSILLTHAEHSALKNVPREKVRGATMFAVRRNSLGDLRNSRPCPSCQHEMKIRGVKRCYYSIDNDTIGILDFRHG